jgi:hypothetical protein
MDISKPAKTSELRAELEDITGLRDLDCTFSTVCIALHHDVMYLQPNMSLQNRGQALYPQLAFHKTIFFATEQQKQKRRDEDDNNKKHTEW